MISISSNKQDAEDGGWHPIVQVQKAMSSHILYFLLVLF